MSDMELRKTIEIDAPARAVFRALTDSRELTQWWPDIGTFEPKVGGKFHFTFLAKHLKELGDKEMGDRDRQLGGDVLELVLNKSWSTPSYRTKNTGQTAYTSSQR